jgi:hypothetical protein
MAKELGIETNTYKPKVLKMLDFYFNDHIFEYVQDIYDKKIKKPTNKRKISEIYDEEVNEVDFQDNSNKIDELTEKQDSIIEEVFDEKEVFDDN